VHILDIMRDRQLLLSLDSVLENAKCVDDWTGHRWAFDTQTPENMTSIPNDRCEEGGKGEGGQTLKA